ncbi:MAG: hypothetical protein MJA29_09195 [Candidatus Omnitrophica bacterium]|nr:hypothetical protein [Candidatus Omnitrophota bacterium]
MMLILLTALLVGQIYELALKSSWRAELKAMRHEVDRLEFERAHLDERLQLMRATCSEAQEYASVAESQFKAILAHQEIMAAAAQRVPDGGR